MKVTISVDRSQDRIILFQWDLSVEQLERLNKLANELAEENESAILNNKANEENEICGYW